MVCGWPTLCPTTISSDAGLFGQEDVRVSSFENPLECPAAAGYVAVRWPSPCPSALVRFGRRDHLTRLGGVLLILITIPVYAPHHHGQGHVRYLDRLFLRLLAVFDIAPPLASRSAVVLAAACLYRRRHHVRINSYPGWRPASELLHAFRQHSIRLRRPGCRPGRHRLLPSARPPARTPTLRRHPCRTCPGSTSSPCSLALIAPPGIMGDLHRKCLQTRGSLEAGS